MNHIGNCPLAAAERSEIPCHGAGRRPFCPSDRRRLRSSFGWCSAAAAAFALAAFVGCAEHAPESVRQSAPTGPGGGAAGSAASHGALAHGRGERLPQLVDRTVEWGLEHRNQTGSEENVYSIVEVTGGGLAALDFDLDSRPDLFTLGGGSFDAPGARVLGAACQLHWNRSGKMQPVGTVARAALSDFYSLGAARGDANEDGFEDLVVTGYGGVALLVNQGDGTFSKQLLATDPRTFAVAAAVVDLDRDRSPDIYVTDYCDWSFQNNPRCVRGNDSNVRNICSPTSFRGKTDLIYSRNAEGRWVQVEGSTRMPPVEDFQTTAMSVLAADLTGDALLDLYVVNDGLPNQLYVQQPKGGYLEQGIVRGVAVGGNAEPNGSMGIALGDIDADSHADLVVTNFQLEPIAVYLGRPRGIFQFGSRQIGVNNAGKSYVSWGTAMVDLDADADLDLVVVNGHVYRDRAGNRQPGLVFVNCAANLVEQTKAVSPDLLQPSESRGLALADYDLDGRCDFAIGVLEGTPRLIQNVTPEAEGIWLNLIGVDSPRDPVGALVTLQLTPQMVLQWSQGGSYASSHHRGLYLPVTNPDEPLRISIRWPTGRVQQADLAAGSKMAVVVEGREPIYPVQ